jgi:hypothetical protein
VRELRNRTELREEVALLGEFEFSDSKWETFTEWLNSPPVPFQQASLGGTRFNFGSGIGYRFDRGGGAASLESRGDLAPSTGFVSLGGRVHLQRPGEADDGIDSLGIG